jgi:proliferating cell nuclear antigen PCNA
MNLSIQDLQKADIFLSIFKDIKLFTNDINIMFEQERMYIQSMDNAHVMLFEIILPKTWFSKYEPISGSSTIGIRCDILYRILNIRDKNQTIQIQFSTTDELTIDFESQVKGEFTKHFKVPLVDLDYQILNIPENEEDDVEITMESAVFAKLIGQLALFGDSLHMEFTEDKIVFSANNSESEEMKTILKTDDLNSYSINEGATIRLDFSLKYLQNICKFNKLSNKMELKINESRPMKIIYNLNLTDTKQPEKMVFYLAPKIED